MTLQAHLGAATPAEHAALYRQAVALSSGSSAVAPSWRRASTLAYGISFDVEKLSWELNFFVRHFLEAYRGVTLGEAERAAIGEEWAAITGELAAEPRVLCHRDYHSRNLMFHEGSLHIIDFQDARMGPDTYDLASLLRDSYVDISDGELDELVALFPRAQRDCRCGRVPSPLRPDVAAAQSEGARHLRLPDHHTPQPRVHPAHAADAELRARQSEQVPALRAAARDPRQPRRGAWVNQDRVIWHGHLVIDCEDRVNPSLIDDQM